MTQVDVAERLGVRQQAIASWESGTKNPEVPRLHQIAKLYGVSTDWLLTGKESRPAERSRAVVEGGNAMIVELPRVHRLPVMRGAADHRHVGGTGPDAVEANVRYDRAHHYCLRIVGSSMEPTLSEDDFVIVRKLSLYLPPLLEERGPSDPKVWRELHGKVIVALVNEAPDEDRLVKRLRLNTRKHGGFHMLLAGDNPKSEPIEISPEHSLRVIGRVVEKISHRDL